jgi:hypothetical protein
MPERSGYSDKPLHAKLGLKAGQRVLLRHAPPEYFEWLELPAQALEVAAKAGKAEPFVHLFLKNPKTLASELSKAAKHLDKNGALWVSWRKGKKDGFSDTEIRSWALKGKLVDVKVCAVSEEWSALKLVWRKEHR